MSMHLLTPLSPGEIRLSGCCWLHQVLGPVKHNLLVDDIDFEEQQVWVLDPSGRRYAPPASLQQQPRFKGRAIATTYLFPPLRQAFFKALEQYFKHEYVPCSRPGQSRYHPI